MRFLIYDDMHSILDVLEDIPEEGPYIQVPDDTLDINLISIYVNDFGLPDYFIAKKNINGEIVDDHTDYWRLLKSKVSNLLQESMFILDNNCKISAANKAQWIQYRKDLQEIANANEESCPWYIVLPDKPATSGFSYNESLKIDLRQAIEMQVGDLSDQVADIAKNLNMLERLCVRLFAHIFNIIPMTPETIERYSLLCYYYINAVDTGAFVDRGDLEAEMELFMSLFDKRNLIGYLAKTLYIDKKIPETQQ